MTCERFTVVRVPFPFTDREASRNRPALVLSASGAFTAPVGHAVMAMITSATNAPWPLDHTVRNLEAAGLPAPSVVRGKLFTLDLRLVRGELGTLADADQAGVETMLRALLGMRSEAP